jgi:hypothetical protein
VADTVPTGGVALEKVPQARAGLQVAATGVVVAAAS